MNFQGVTKMLKASAFFVTRFISSFFNNRMAGKTLAPEAFKVGSNMGNKYIRVIQGRHPEGVPICGGLQGSGGDFKSLAFRGSLFSA